MNWKGENVSTDDKELLEKFKKLAKISHRINESKMAKILGLSSEQLLEKLMEWGEKFPIKIEGESIIIEDSDALDSYTDALDKQFASWTGSERVKEGKLGGIEQARFPPRQDITEAASPSFALRYEGIGLGDDDIALLVAMERELGFTIPRVESIEEAITLGFSTSEGHVTGLGLPGKGLTVFPASICEMTSLQFLDLSHNHITALPDSIGQLRSLQILWLTDNELASLPDSIGELNSLTYLDLNSNDLSSIPDAVMQITGLQVLGFGRNLLSTIPSTIGQLTALKELYLGGNELVSLPGSVGLLKSLTYLDLAHNGLTSFPEGIVDLIGLNYLLLNGNSFGALPRSIKEWIKDLVKRGCKVKQ